MDAVVRAGVEATGHFRSTPGLLTELLYRGSWQVYARALSRLRDSPLRGVAVRGRLS